MATVITDDKNYTNIANSIREKSVTNKKYTPAEMPTGVNEVYEKGKKDMAKTWWKAICAEGQRRYFSYAFYQFDFSKVGGFNPSNQLLPLTSSYMFYKCKGLGKIKKEQIDYTKSSKFDHTFYNSEIEEIEYFYPYSCASLTRTFAYCFNLHTIGFLGLALKPGIGDRYYNDTFSHTSALANINEISGTFKDSVSFASSPLTLESAIRVIMALDASPVSMSVTITFKQSVWGLLDANPPSSLGYDDIAASSQDNWKMYILSRCWMYS